MGSHITTLTALNYSTWNNIVKKRLLAPPYSNQLIHSYKPYYGCSRNVTHPVLRETFAPIMELALRRSARAAITELFV
ncbi:hypothetical protein Psch_04120 [Pelotomaculum schinkii]|uniref:Uncharacterized protein n=1 Tax=Pelotomaculum schinkii TaxID=78350 RepID=A0A4Y7R6K5_9FIRM|nr:hypothetical protein Psch_04120 [Pelotomaculum schinkii]